MYNFNNGEDNIGGNVVSWRTKYRIHCGIIYLILDTKESCSAPNGNISSSSSCNNATKEEYIYYSEPELDFPGNTSLETEKRETKSIIKVLDNITYDRRSEEELLMKQKVCYSSLRTFTDSDAQTIIEFNTGLCMEQIK